MFKVMVNEKEVWRGEVVEPTVRELGGFIEVWDKLMGYINGPTFNPSNENGVCLEETERTPGHFPLRNPRFKVRWSGGEFGFWSLKVWRKK